MKREYHAMTLSRLAYLEKEDIIKQLPNGFEFVVFFTFDEVQGFVCKCDEGEVLAFRGSEAKINDWKANFDITLKNTDIGRVQEGYYNALMDCEDMIRCFIRDKKVLVTGHSAGGAYSVLYSKILDARHGFDTKCIAFEPPRVCDTHKFNPKVFFTINSADIVPRFPLKAMHYRHTGTLIYFTPSGKAKENTKFIKRLVNFFTDIDDVVKDHECYPIEKLWFKKWETIKNILNK